MKITRLRFRLAEMVIAPLALCLVDGLIHRMVGEPFMTEFLAGGVLAVVFIRGIDALRAIQHRWPETDATP